MGNRKQRASLLTPHDIQMLGTYGLLELVKDNRYIHFALEVEKSLKEAGFRDLDFVTYMLQMSRILSLFLERNAEIREKLADLDEKKMKSVIMTLSLAIIERLRADRMATIEIYEEREEKAILKGESVRKRVFVIMPISPDFDNIWKDGIERACKSRGFNCVRANEIVSPTSITSAIEGNIEMADFVVADITGVNPNVMYEIGLARAMGKKIIGIRQKSDTHKVPFDILHIPYISYDNTQNGIVSLSEEIGRFLTSASKTSS